MMAVIAATFSANDDMILDDQRSGLIANVVENSSVPKSQNGPREHGGFTRPGGVPATRGSDLLCFQADPAPPESDAPAAEEAAADPADAAPAEDAADAAAEPAAAEEPADAAPEEEAAGDARL